MPNKLSQESTFRVYEFFQKHSLEQVIKHWEANKNLESLTLGTEPTNLDLRQSLLGNLISAYKYLSSFYHLDFDDALNTLSRYEKDKTKDKGIIFELRKAIVILKPYIDYILAKLPIKVGMVVKSKNNEFYGVTTVIKIVFDDKKPRLICSGVKDRLLISQVEPVTYEEIKIGDLVQRNIEPFLTPLRVIKLHWSYYEKYAVLENNETFHVEHLKIIEVSE